LTVTCEEYSCYLTESQPDGNTNLAFDEDVVYKNFILRSKVDKDSTTAYFLKPEVQR